MTHPITDYIREMLISQAVQLNAGSTADDHNEEYLRGQAELIANSTGAYEFDDDAEQTIRQEILAGMAAL